MNEPGYAQYYLEQMRIAKHFGYELTEQEVYCRWLYDITEGERMEYVQYETNKMIEGIKEMLMKLPLKTLEKICDNMKCKYM